MFKKTTRFVLPVLAGLFLLQGCQDKKKKGEFTQGPGSLEYQLYAKGKDGKYEVKEAPAKMDTSNYGKVIVMQQIVKTDKDSVLFNSLDTKAPAMSMLQKSKVKGSLEDGLMMLQPGDSGVFRISADTLFGRIYNQPMPPFLKKGSKLIFNVKVEKIITRDEAMAEQQKMQEKMQQEMMNHAQDQAKVDDGIIQKYLADNKMTAEKTPAGLYYVITKKGTGVTPKPGQIVAVQYKGTTLNGKEFDSSAKHGGNPFEFQIGQGQVIRGWDEGIMLLNKGTKATLLVPSPMAYGSQGAGADIPADAVLRFDVELVDIK
jgi:FKBP-type peptidyl-prolyl cis-trans isomerase FkpA